MTFLCFKQIVKERLSFFLNFIYFYKSIGRC